MSKTEFLLNDIGHTLDEDPRPLTYAGPTEKNVKGISAKRVMPMIESVPSLNAGHLKGHEDKIDEKSVNGVRLGFAWAGSATELASWPTSKFYVDERDRMKDIAEGDVDSIIQEAVATYAGQIITVSTPLSGDVIREYSEEIGRDVWKVADGDDVSSPIWLLWQEGSRHEWVVPCTNCLEYFAPHLDLLEWDDELPAKKVGKTAVVRCPYCGHPHRNTDKEQMNSLGVFVAPDETIQPRPKKLKKAKSAVINSIEVMFGSYLDRGEEALSFWVSGLCSPWSSWGSRATSLKKARDSKKPNKEKGVINTQFGQVFKAKGKAPNWEILKDLVGGYQVRSIPEGVRVLTAGVDVHKRRLNFVVRGWGVGYESWLIDYGEIFGEIKYLDDIAWNHLGGILNTLYGKQGIPIALMLIDSGYKPNDEPADASVIYQFCYQNKRAAPAKGHDRKTRAYSAANMDISYKGKSIKDGLQLWHLDSDYFKQFVYGRYEWDPEKAGGWHLPAEIEEEYLRQVTAEARVEKNGLGVWEKIRQANHYFDCEYMATAAAHILRLHKLKPDDETSSQTKTRKRSRTVHRRK